MRHIFHLSIPVAELGPAKQFYVEVLGARVGRENTEWLDVLLWGHHEGTSEEQAKMYLNDPSHNVIEIKAYKNVAGTLGLHD